MRVVELFGATGDMAHKLFLFSPETNEYDTKWLLRES